MVKKYFRLIIFIAVILLVVLYFKDVQTIFKSILIAFKPVLIALFIALIFNIPITFLNKKIFYRIKNDKIKKTLSITITYLFVFGLVCVGLYFLVPSIINSGKVFIEKLPEYGNDFEEKLNNIMIKIGISQGQIDNIINGLKDKIIILLGGAKDIISGTINFLKESLNLFFAVIISVYILYDKDRLICQIKKFIKSITTDKVSNMLNNGAKVSSVIFAQFLGGQFIEALLLGLFTMLGMYLLKLPYVPIVSCVVFVANLIPLIGAYIGGAVGFILISFVSLKQGVIFIIFSVILQQIENNFFYPRVVGKSLGLSGFWIMTAVLVGGSLFGFWGIMLGVPFVAVIYKSLGHRLKTSNTAGELLPDILKQSGEK